MNRTLDVATSHLASVAQLGRGFLPVAKGPRPEKMLELYEFEACPFCRRVREAVSALELSVLVKPCPKGGTRFRPELIERGGRAQFPYLVDPNLDLELYESADIVAHLFRHYGRGSVPLAYTTPAALPSAVAAGLFRPGLGGRARPSRAPEQPLELWGMDASPYTRIVRETLCERELPYVLHTTPLRSPRWRALKQRAGRAMVPWLSDPNTGVEMHESADIQRYLIETWGAPN